MRLITIINLLSLLFTPISKPNTINGFGGATTDISPFSSHYTNEQVGTFAYSDSETYAPFSYWTPNDPTSTYRYFVSTFYIVDSDPVLFTDIFINIRYNGSDIDDSVYYLHDSSIWEFTIYSSDSAPEYALNNSLFTAMSFSSFDYALSYNGLNNDGEVINYYHIHTDFVLDQYNYIIFRCNLDYYDNVMVGGDIGGAVYNEAVWDDVSDNYPLINFFESSSELPYFILLNNTPFDSGYYDGFNDGVASVDTDIYYQQGVDSVNVDAIYANAYNDGYNVGITESSHDYGISNLLFSIFDIPIIVMSNLFSFTIFGTEVWGLLISLMFVSFILFVTIKLLGKSSD